MAAERVGTFRYRHWRGILLPTLGAAMVLTPGTAPCTRADAERLFEVAEKPVDIGVVCV